MHDCERPLDTSVATLVNVVTSEGLRRQRAMETTKEGDGSAGQRKKGQRWCGRWFFFSLFFFLPPSADTARNRSLTVEIDRYRSILGGNEAKTAPICSTAR
ncbi:hypothetical protein BHM03_00029521 [Ensete ventricosum]|nr:hypothetical protein BHM03_00029521 [Ensete ventricosum]